MSASVRPNLSTLLCCAPKANTCTCEPTFPVHRTMNPRSQCLLLNRTDMEGLRIPCSGTLDHFPTKHTGVCGNPIPSQSITSLLTTDTMSTHSHSATHIPWNGQTHPTHRYLRTYSTLISHSNKDINLTATHTSTCSHAHRQYLSHGMDVLNPYMDMYSQPTNSIHNNKHIHFTT